MDKKAALLGELPFFATLNEEQIENLGKIARFTSIKRGQTLFRQGEPVEGMFFLLSGQLKIFKLAPDGKEHILHIIRPGQGFAEAALFMNGYPAWCDALQKSEVVCLPKSRFLELLTAEPDLSLGIIASMSQYLRRFADQIEDLSLKDVSARLARWLLATSEENGRDFWDLAITKGQLASQLGTVSETLSRTLRKFQDSELLEVRGKFMKIKNREELKKIAEGLQTYGD